VSRDLRTSIRTYAAMVDSLHLYDESLEVSNVLVWREAIHEVLRGGARLGLDDRVVLEQADAKLLTLGPDLVYRFPEVFEVNGDIPIELWWWHLEKGPQVREYPAAARSSGTASDN
jgi:hypothetical protein